MRKPLLPRILIVDDLFGRVDPEGRNEERANLCGQYLLVDVSGDGAEASGQKINDPTAEVVFYRGQAPICSAVGDTVENDLDGVLRVVRQVWEGPAQTRCAMVLVDLCFRTGSVTVESDRRAKGMPEGRTGDDAAESYFGLRILRALQDEFPDLPVLVLSSKPRDEVSHAFAYHGALGFLSREEARSPELLREYLWRHGLVQDPTGEIVGCSKSLLLALRSARRGAGSGNVLIRGERGVGKEFLARYIHRQRHGISFGPFVVVNSAVLSAELFASELFGIERGVATGVEARIGLIRSAEGGHLFFDEISDMVPQAQAGILRVLEERHLWAVGATGPSPVDVRFLSGTNVDIESIAVSGRFRSDLLDRLREGGTVLLPPLRERKDDIPLLVERFIRDAEALTPGTLHREVDQEAMDLLQSYAWPGNIRQLRSCILAAVNGHPDVEHLVPLHLRIPPMADSTHLSLGASLPDIARDFGLTMAHKLQSELDKSKHTRNGISKKSFVKAVQTIMARPAMSEYDALELICSIFLLAPELTSLPRMDAILEAVFKITRQNNAPHSPDLKLVKRRPVVQQ